MRRRLVTDSTFLPESAYILEIEIYNHKESAMDTYQVRRHEVQAARLSPANHYVYRVPRKMSQCVSIAPELPKHVK